MRRMSYCQSWVAVLGFVLLAGIAGGAVARAEEAPDGTIRLEASLEPADLGPGQDGFLVVESVIEHELHVYAKDEAKLVFKPLPAEGVTYHLLATPMSWEVFEKTPGKVVWTKPTPYQDPNYTPEELPPFPVWLPDHPFTLKVPVTIAADAAAGTEIGLLFDYAACDELMCYDRVRGQKAAVVLGAAADAGAGPVWKAGPAAKDDHVEVTIAYDAEKGEVVVVFAPKPGSHVYMPGSEEGLPVAVEPQPDTGVTWADVAYEDEGGTVHGGDAFEARIPVERTEEAERIRVKVTWQACTDFNCFSPEEAVLELTKEGVREVPPVVPVPPDTPEPKDPEPKAEPEVKPGEKVLVEADETVPYPRVYGDDLDEPRTDGDWRIGAAPVGGAASGTGAGKLTFLGLLLSFVTGVGLTFTPCVLPIIPLTISVIGGGAAGKVSRGRLAVMLTVYALGLALTYGAAGAASGLFGKVIDLDAMFRVPAFIIAVSAFFVILGASMLGIFEMQPPAWMERIRGGAAQKGGTLLGSFLLGAVAALVASPCTGPFVVAKLAHAAAESSPVFGFAHLFVLGLGMGAVFFAAGSLNLLAKPGPWMVWVRYAFGVILIGVALYFIASGGLIEGPMVFVVGFALALLTWFAVARHLIKKEGERPGVAQKRGAILAVILVLVTGLVAHLTHHPAHPAESDWAKVTTVEALQEQLARAKAEKRPAVVDVWATWCHNCKEYDKVIEGDPYLLDAFGRFVKIKVDESVDDLDDLRTHVGLPTSGQPRMAFFDEEGRIRKAAEIEQWFGTPEDSNRELRRRVDFILGRTR